ncbi:hypothetical protein PoB_006241500 [Plakobranchus ocellatus]|uniref:CCHC-type domain-containing protein n=1 Tax=Plakobranchus ocellatus TaxID=259542 RepID=A0AAV4CVL4_9GAST|nr:hypothetical protein PoB_006241500 [Plakobranchus ocellatus]
MIAEFREIVTAVENRVTELRLVGPVTQHQPVNNNNPMGNKTVPITCYTCGRQGHTTARCYKQGSKTDTTTRQSAGEKGKDS